MDTDTHLRHSQFLTCPALGQAAALASALVWQCFSVESLKQAAAGGSEHPGAEEEGVVELAGGGGGRTGTKQAWRSAVRQSQVASRVRGR